MQERLSFLSIKQNLACVSASLHLPIVHAAPIFRSFESSSWHISAWKWLLEKHSIARQAFFAIGYHPRPKEPALTVLNLPGLIFTLLVTQIKIVVIEPAKPISACCFR